MRNSLAALFVLSLLSTPAFAKDPSQGATTYTFYEGWMSPQQQPGEETDAPKALAKVTGLQSTEPSVPREQRKSRGWGQLKFSRDLTKAHIDVEIKDVKPEDIIMFHVHCGPPGVLGPIIINFGAFGDLTKMLAKGKLSLDIQDKDIVYIKSMPGLKPALPESCPAELGFLPTQAMTVAALEYLARKGVLYFNLHTKANTFYGEMRGQIYAVPESK